jgi:hypothetical protein
MKRTARTHVFVAFLAACAAAWADEPLPPQDRPGAFQKLDTDKDGFVSRQEAAAQPEVAANFDKADRDKDGRLSLEEFDAVPLNRSDQPGTFRTPERG